MREALNDFVFCIQQMLLFFTLYGPCGLLCSDIVIPESSGLAGIKDLHNPVSLLNRLSQPVSAVFELCMIPSLF